MKKAIAIVISLLFVFAITSVTFAAEAKKEAPVKEEKKVEKKASPKQVTGEVAAVDAKANTLTVKGKKGDVTVSVDDKTKIMAGKDKKTLADVKAGDKVTVKYVEADGKNTAKHVEIKAAPAKKEEKKAEKAAPAAAPAAKPAEKKPKAAGY